MDRAQALRVLEASLSDVAPEVRLAEVDHDADLLEELDLDSMDFLSLVTDLAERSGLQIPESDYPRLSSVAATVDYLSTEG
jgi:acyl carrier protein